MTTKINVNPKGKICVRWDTTPYNYSKENELSIRHSFATKYGIPFSNVILETNFTQNGVSSQNGLNYENIANIKDPKFQQELFKQYIQENKIENCDFDEIIKIDSKINALINYDNYETGKRYSIKWIKWSNFLSYGEDNFFDFTTLKGLVLLSGKPANESGKSTFAYDLLHFLLFGNKTNSEKAKTLEHIFNNYRPESTKVEVEGCINIDGFDYIIKRTLTRPELGKKNRNVTQKVEYYQINENGFKQELNDLTTTQTTKTITDALGGESDFNMIISANAKDLDSLISMKDTERGKLLTRWIGLSVLEDKDEKAREVWNKDISKKRYCSIYNREQLNTEITTLETTNRQESEYITSETKRQNSANSELTRLNNEKNLLIQSKRPINKDIVNVDVTTLMNEIGTIVTNGKNAKQLKEQKEKELETYPDVIIDEDRYKLLISEKEQLVADVAVLRSQILSLKNQNNVLKSSEYCPTCHRKLDNVDNSGLINTNLLEIDKLTQTGVEKSNKIKELTSEIETIEKNRKIQKDKNAIELKIAAYSSDIERFRALYAEKNAIKNAIDQNKDSISENNKIDAAINVLEVSISTNNKIIIDTTYNIACSQRNISSNNQIINEKRSIIVKINEEEKEEFYWKIYLAMIGKNGISKIVLRNSLPIINAELSRLLSGVADFDVEVEINDKNDVDFWLIRDGIKTRLTGASGLERTQAALALRVVLGKMSNLSRPPFLLLDEILGTVAKENYDKMRDLYEKIVKEYDFILHITHLTDIIDWHDSNIVVVKENNISKITR